MGWLAFHTKGKLHDIAAINVAMCFPTYTEAQRRGLVKSSLIETGKSFTEAAWLWTQPPANISRKVSWGEGQEIYKRCLEDPKGLLMATPHWGAWELCCHALSKDRPLTYMYRQPRIEALDGALIKWRANLGGQPASLDSGGIRKAMKALKQGEIVGMLPDQEPDRDAGVFAPFFNVPANTMTLMGKFISRTNANALFCISERLPNAQGWTVRIIQPESEIGSEDKVLAATAINKTVERCIAVNPTQYNWSYKRFGRLPNGSKRNYSLK